ncbi:hypothetical protein FHT00_001671 [Sphingomonas insulae]|nr:hypothetical protein [Sphingomonas insulae]NIJ29724.1 hypothetical protein [Sphingomonas insulae]
MDDRDENTQLGQLLRNPWFQGASALGVLLGIVGFIIGLPPVSEIAFGKRMSLKLDVVSQIPVFAVRQPVPGLSVQLNSQDLTQSKRDLVAVRLRLRNDGEIGINSRNTTPQDPLGFTVRGGEVVRLYERGATSEHLRKLGIPVRSGEAFRLPPGLIIDPADYLQFDLLIVRPVNGQLSFQSLGKVEGLREIGVGRTDMTKPSPSAASVAWSGGLLPQLLRTITYPFIAIAILGASIASGFWVSTVANKRKKRLRKAYARDASLIWEEADAKTRKLVTALYTAIGQRGLNTLTDKELEAAKRKSRESRQKKFDRSGRAATSDFEISQWIDDSLEGPDISSMTAESLLFRLGMRDPVDFSLDEKLREALESFQVALSKAVSSSKLKKSEPSKEDLFVTEHGITVSRSWP